MTMPSITPDLIFQVASGFMAAKHLFIANEVRLFEQLADGPATLDELAERTGVARHRLRILADAMVVLGFVQRQGDLYQNAPIAATFLTGRTLTDLRPFLRFWNHLSYPTWTKLEDAVRTGHGQSTLHLPEEAQRIFSEPAFAALMAGEFLVITGEGDVYSEEEAHRWLKETGWRAVERKPLAGPISLIVAETAG